VGPTGEGKALSNKQTLLKVREPGMHRGVALDQLAGHIDGVDQRVQREGLHRGRARGGLGGGQHLALDRLDRADQAGGVVGQRGDGDGVGAVGVDEAGHLDDGVVVEHGEGALVADVEDQGGALVAGDGPHQGEGDLLVAAGEVVGVAFAGAGRLPVLGHVGGLALGAGAVPDVQRPGTGGADLVVEPRLLVGEEGAAGLLGLLVGADGLAVEVVVVQVLVGDRAEGLEPVDAEELALLEGAEQVGVGEQPGQLVPAGDLQTADPAEVVEADVVDPGLVGVGAEHARDTAAEAHRGVADADDAVAEVAGHGLGDQPGRVGEVDDPGVGGEAGHAPGDVHGHRDRAQAVGDAARADRLLAEDALREGHPLVVGTALQAADADRREDEVGAAQSLVEVGRGGHRGGARDGRRLFGEDPADRGEPARVQVVQDDLGHPALGAVGEQRAVHERDPEAAAAENRQFHRVPPKLPRRSGWDE
jgi:hypothetical protein